MVTPVGTHFELAKVALENGKHVFVEKPFTSTTQQAEELIELADRKNLRIMVDHTFLFTGAVRKMRQLIDEGVLGDLYYYDSTRVNLGLFQHDVSVIWDLAPHDLSVMDFLIQEKPEAVVATGEAHLNGHVDVAFITIYYPGNTIAHLNATSTRPFKCASPVAITASGFCRMRKSTIDRSCGARSQTTLTSCWKSPRLTRVES